MPADQATITSEEKVQTIDEIAAENEAAAKAAEQSDEETSGEPGDEKVYAGKFKSVEELEKGFEELQKRFSSGERGGTEDDTGDSQEGENTGLSVSQEDAEDAADKAGLDFSALTAKYADKGELDDSDYEALDKAGIPRDTVENFIKGQEALARQYENEVLSAVGGREAYNDLSKWAAENLSEGQLKAYNEAVESGDVEKAQFAVEGLRAKFESANGREPTSRVSAQPSTKGPVYESRAEWVADMQDPRYWSDEGFRAKVERKFENSMGSI